jgi:protoheme IX farnesyltransferase
MKATAQPLPQLSTVDKGWFAIASELFKARLTFLVLLTTLVGFYIGTVGPVDYLLMVHTLLGTALVAAGASALNQFWERDLDARMRRTQDRPLPSGRMQPQSVLLIGCGCSVLGLAYLAAGVNMLTSALGAISLLTYVFVYTPLKRVTWLNTVVGAVPGGLPPLMGWTAARGHLSADGWALFGILALWQLPHFMAIAWMYRDEYARAGFKMLPVVDPDGQRTGSQAVTHTLALVPVSLCPSMMNLTGQWYFFGALILGLIFIGSAVQFSRQLTLSKARQLFYVSILYLPLLLGLMVLDKAR